MAAARARPTKPARAIASPWSSSLPRTHPSQTYRSHGEQPCRHRQCSARPRQRVSSQSQSPQRCCSRHQARQQPATAPTPKRARICPWQSPFPRFYALRSPFYAPASRKGRDRKNPGIGPNVDLRIEVVRCAAVVHSTNDRLIGLSPAEAPDLQRPARLSAGEVSALKASPQTLRPGSPFGDINWSAFGAGAQRDSARGGPSIPLPGQLFPELIRIQLV
jgi:hypothetical protein